MRFTKEQRYNDPMTPENSVTLAIEKIGNTWKIVTHDPSGTTMTSRQSYPTKELAEKAAVEIWPQIVVLVEKYLGPTKMDA